MERLTGKREEKKGLGKKVLGAAKFVGKEMHGVAKEEAIWARNKATDNKYANKVSQKLEDSELYQEVKKGREKGK